MAFGVLATVNGIGDFLSKRRCRLALVGPGPNRGVRLQRCAIPPWRRVNFADTPANVILKIATCRMLKIGITTANGINAELGIFSVSFGDPFFIVEEAVLPQ
jgi:hypothetical protein